MSNRPLTPPPMFEPITDDQSMMNRGWQQWMNELRFLIQFSNQNKQLITETGEVDGNAGYVDLRTTTSSYAITLNVPTIPGIYKVIEMTARGGANNVTMSLANVTGGSASTTCTWNSVGDTLVLVSRSNKWTIIKEDGVTLT